MIRSKEKFDIPTIACNSKGVGSTRAMSLLRRTVVAVSLLSLAGCDNDTYEPDNSQPIPVPGKVIVDEHSVDQYIENQEPQAERRDGVGRNEMLHDQDSVRETRLQLEDGNRFNELQPNFIQLDENRDGSISLDEWPLDHSFTFTSSDLDNDGLVSRREFLDSHNDEVVSQ